MTLAEARAEGWEDHNYEAVTVIEFQDGALAYPSRDEEGNGPGALFGVVGGKTVAFYQQ